MDTTFLLNQNCIPDCPKGYFSNPTNRECEDCLDNCDVCTKEKRSECDTCKEGYELSRDKKKCLKKCNKAETRINLVCIGCKVNNCDKCDTDINTCDICEDPKIRLLNIENNKVTCVTVCSNGYFMSKVTTISNTIIKMCTKCFTNCKTCDDTTSCLVCEDNLFLIENKRCELSCPEGYAPSGNKCIKCEKPQMQNVPFIRYSKMHSLLRS